MKTTIKKRISLREKAYLFLVLCAISSAAAQNASDYFPSKVGNTWRYQKFVLDTSQLPIASSKTIESDTLSGGLQVGGVAASVTLNRSGSILDSTYINVQGSTISEYVVGYPRIATLLPVDSLGLDFVWDYLNWYPYMKFTATPGVTDTLLYLKNQVIKFKGQYLTLIIRVTTTRLPDTSVTVPAGTYITSPFQIVLTVNIPKSQPPFGRYEVPLFRLVDTMFIAKNSWLVREVQPSTYYPLNNDPSYQVATTQVPGFVRELESASITSVSPREGSPREFSL